MRRFIQFLIPILFAMVSIGLLVAAQGNAMVRSRIARLRTLGQCREPPFLAEFQRFIARNFHAFEWMIRFDFLLHLRFDLFEIVRRNPVG